MSYIEVIGSNISFRELRNSLWSPLDGSWQQAIARIYGSQVKEGGMEEREFRKLLHQDGYGEPELVDIDARSSDKMHAHDFTAFGLVVEGEFILLNESGRCVYNPGDTCKVERGFLHNETSGPCGAKVLVGMK